MFSYVTETMTGLTYAQDMQNISDILECIADESDTIDPNTFQVRSFPPPEVDMTMKFELDAVRPFRKHSCASE
jgi:hypothetical protein